MVILGTACFPNGGGFQILHSEAVETMAYEGMIAETISINGQVGVLGTCSGGRQAFLFACHTNSIDAVVELWGGRVVMGKDELTEKQPTAPIEVTRNLPLILVVWFRTGPVN